MLCPESGCAQQQLLGLQRTRAAGSIGVGTEEEAGVLVSIARQQAEASAGAGPGAKVLARARQAARMTAALALAMAAAVLAVPVATVVAVVTGSEAMNGAASCKRPPLL